jgi:acyl phosphate:glycerol-3-phosphate acyltransferase
MTTLWVGLFWVVLAYFVGAVPFGYLFVRLRQGRDIREVGSGNIGATNVLRASGLVSGIVTLLLDAAKGYLAVLVAGLLTHQDGRFMASAAGAAVLGHVFPIYLRFRGGKGVATSAGALLGLAVLSTTGAILVFLLVVALWRYVSLASIFAAALLPIFYFLLEYRHQPSITVLLAVVFCCVLVIIRHAENIRRLVAGTENTLTGHKK